MYSKEHLKVINSALLRPQDLLTFVEIDPFPGQWARYKLSDADLNALQIVICAEPEMGAVVPEAGGLRKARFSVPGSHKGKSSSFRIFYVYFREYGSVFLWAIIGKGDAENLSKADRNAIAKAIQRTKRLLDRGVRL